MQTDSSRFGTWIRAGATAVLSVLCVSVSAGPSPYRMNDTGQNLCLDFATRTWKSACADSGQDAARGRDVAHPGDRDGVAGFRFVRVCNNGSQEGTAGCPAPAALGVGPEQWGCTYDRVTRILWQLKSTDGSPRDRTRRYTHYAQPQAGYGEPTDAAWLVDWTNSTGSCGRTDWSLPEVNEAYSIMLMRPWTPETIVDEAFFPPDGWPAMEDFWTSTRPQSWGWSEINGCSLARCSLHILGPFVMSYANDAFDQAEYLPGVLLVSRLDPVRAGASGRFVPSDEGSEVFDRATGLVWKRCAEGETWDGSACAGWASQFRSFADALEYVTAAYPPGTGGWFIPNVKELLSLLDVARVSSGLLDPLAFPSTVNGEYWSSTAAGFDYLNVYPISYKVSFREAWAGPRAPWGSSGTVHLRMARRP